MYQENSINLLNLLLSLSDALDLASPLLALHQMRTAFIAWEIAEAADLSKNDLEELFIAALLHDVGALSPEEKINIHKFEVVDPEPHCILGEAFLSKIPMFETSSRYVRYHHKPWREWEQSITDPVVYFSQILFLADTLERMLDRSKYILHQDKALVDHLCSLKTEIYPEILDIFKKVSEREDFWLDLTSTRLYSILLHNAPCRGTEIDFSQLLDISIMFKNLIDFRSRFTSTHSTGVSESASLIAHFFGLTEVEIDLMKVAGNLHDLGKLVISNSILEKPAKLTEEEYAIMRQHTYFTYSVLITIGGIENIAEWAAFHHERLDGSGYPFHLTAKKLNTSSRIMAVADVLTAVAEDRPYRKGMEKSQIIELLTNMGKKNYLDRTIISVLEKNFDEIVGVTKEKQEKAFHIYEAEFSKNKIL